MKIVFISDTHNKLQKVPVLPDGDVLVHAGDLTGRGEIWEMEKQLRLLGEYPHKTKIFVCGNHDWLGEKNPVMTRELCIKNGIIYLEDQEVSVDGVKFYGSPVSPEFFNWAFNRQRGSDIKRYWDNIPVDTDVLVTHGPPMGILDEVVMVNGDSYDPPHRVGCQDLLDAVRRIKPKVHAFGHIHCGHGMLLSDGTTFVNASICDEMYDPVNKPQVVEV